MVMEVVHEEMTEENMQCASHPYKNSAPGGICAYCLQEKLGKLASSSFPLPVFPPPSSSASPSFGSDVGAGGASVKGHRIYSSSVSYDGGHEGPSSHLCRHTRSPRLPFAWLRKKKKKESTSATIVFRRSISVTAPGRALQFSDDDSHGDNRPRQRGLWSFLYTPKCSGAKKKGKPLKDLRFLPTNTATGVDASEKKKGEEVLVAEESGDPDEASIDIKVSRSRSIGCGNRSFSGDLFERISSGFGDCRLRRVESQREGKSKARHFRKRGQECTKKRFKCGEIFGGLMINSSSSSSSSSHWVSSSSVEDGKTITEVNPTVKQMLPGGNRGWGWALTSPMRAFSKPCSGKRDPNASRNNGSPNLASTPALLNASECRE